MHADQDDLAALVQAQSFELLHTFGHVVGRWIADTGETYSGMTSRTAALEMSADQAPAVRSGRMRWSHAETDTPDPSSQALSIEGPSPNALPIGNPPLVEMRTSSADSVTLRDSSAALRSGIGKGGAEQATIDLYSGGLSTAATARISGPTGVVLSAKAGGAPLVSPGSVVIGADTDVRLQPGTGRVRLGARTTFLPVAADQRGGGAVGLPGLTFVPIPGLSISHALTAGDLVVISGYAGFRRDLVTIGSLAYLSLLVNGTLTVQSRVGISTVGDESNCHVDILWVAPTTGTHVFELTGSQTGAGGQYSVTGLAFMRTMVYGLR